MATGRFLLVFISIIITDYTVWSPRQNAEWYKLGGNFLTVWVATCTTHGLCIIFYFYKQCQRMKCSCWHTGSVLKRHVCPVCAVARLSCLSVCTSKACTYQIQRPVQVSWGCRQGQQHVLWLPTSPLRHQAASVTFLAKTEQNTVTPFVLVTRSMKMY